MAKHAALALQSAVAALSTVVVPGLAQADPGDLPYGPDTCIQGYVWREARSGDTVCVTPAVRSRTAQENATAADRREPNGGPYGPATCKQGFVWREAFDGDVVCVTPDIRDQTLADNAAAESRKQSNQDTQPKTNPSGPNFAIWSLPDCYVVLDGAGPGRDTLGVGFQLQSLGPGSVDKLIPARIALDTGEAATLNVSQGGGPQGTAMAYGQLTIGSSFYRRDNRVTITADPNNEYIERVESDNSLVVLIPRQPRPANSQIPLKCAVA